MFIEHVFAFVKIVITFTQMLFARYLFAYVKTQTCRRMRRT